MNATQPYEPDTIYHQHAARYLRDADGNKRKARRECLRDREMAADPKFYDAVIRIIDAQQ